ncbi:hypothetical protein L484_006371 [Morus notabilis]|uniref:Uncharacterized protein n=1 Tax=Morus notabilis TaxID=981085 RepID=W9RSB2_9ROSA|nr:hypothetical protein L484_006370 [Morus notabilis]EXC06349.1 hypothetical protein L484_006371 [Morus notabilis]
MKISHALLIVTFALFASLEAKSKSLSTTKSDQVVDHPKPNNNNLDRKVNVGTFDHGARKNKPFNDMNNEEDKEEEDEEEGNDKNKAYGLNRASTSTHISPPQINGRKIPRNGF